MSDQNGTGPTPEERQQPAPAQQAINALQALQNWNIMLLEPPSAGMQLQNRPPRRILFGVGNFFLILQNYGQLINVLIAQNQALEAKVAALENKTQ